MSKHMALIEQRILSFHALNEPDWDGCGAEPVAESSIDTALDYMRHEDFPQIHWQAFPDVNGGLTLEFEDYYGSYIQLDFHGDRVEAELGLMGVTPYHATTTSITAPHEVVWVVDQYLTHKGLYG